MHFGITLENRPHRVPCRQFFASLTDFIFTPLPLACDRIDAGATGNLIGESEVIHDVEHPREDSILSVTLNDALLIAFGNLHCLVCGEQRCAEPGALAPGCEHRGQSPLAANPSGRNYWCVTSHLQDLGKKRQRSELPGVATRLITLRNQHIGTGSESHPGRLQRLYLTEHPGACRFCACDILRGISKGKRYDRNVFVQAYLKVLLVIRNPPSNETDAPAPIRSRL